jgi:hypothetical protein
MSDHDRPTSETCSLIDIDDEKPFPGQKILALTEGSKLIETVWSAKLVGVVFAWTPYPKIPQKVKEKLYAHYMRNADKLVCLG